MKKKVFYLSILSMVILIPLTAMSQATVFVSIPEGTYEGKTDQPIPINVMAKEISNLYGFQLNVKFDNEILNINTAMNPTHNPLYEEGGLLNQDGVQTYLSIFSSEAASALPEADRVNKITQTTGDGLEYVVNTRLQTPGIASSIEGVSGEGALVTIHLKVSKDLAEDTQTEITLEGVKLVDPNAEEIPVLVEGGTINITGGAPCVKGDVNGDTRIRANDALLALQIAVGLIPDPTETQTCAADMNSDERVRANDALLILQTAVGLIPAASPTLVASSTAPLKVRLSKTQGIDGNVHAFLTVDNPQSVGGADIKIAYNTMALVATGVDSAGQDTILAANIDTPGVVQFSTTNLNAFDQELLATIHFKALQPDQATVELREMEFFGLNSFPIDAIIIPDKNLLGQNFPNPFNPETWIPYQLKDESAVTVKIYDVSGRLVRTIDLGQKSPGIYVTREQAAYWDGRNSFGERMASGLYFYTLRTKSYTQTKRMLLVK